MILRIIKQITHITNTKVNKVITKSKRASVNIYFILLTNILPKGGSVIATARISIVLPFIVIIAQVSSHGMYSKSYVCTSQQIHFETTIGTHRTVNKKLKIEYVNNKMYLLYENLGSRCTTTLPNLSPSIVVTRFSL